MSLSQHIVAHDLEIVLARMAGQLDFLRNESLFITGGTGFFGRWLLETLALANRRYAMNLRMTVLTRNFAHFAAEAPLLCADPAIDFCEGDVTCFVFPERKYAYLIHAATTSAHETFNGALPLQKFDTLIQGTRRVLDFAVRAGVRNVLFTSSGVVYGSAHHGESVVEACATAPDTLDSESALGQAKRAAEFLCASYANQYGMNVTIARCFSFVGPFMPLDLHYAIGCFIRQAMRNEEIVIKSDGTAVRSYLYAGDLICWMLSMLRREGPVRVYNTGSDRPITIADLATLVRGALCSEVDVKILGNHAFSIGNPVREYYVPNIERARIELGLDVWTTVEQAVVSTARYYGAEKKSSG